jgi:pyruvate kinase
MVKTLKEAAKQRPKANIAIMLDTKGPEIRTGFLKDHKEIQLEKDQVLEISIFVLTFSN